MSPSDLSQTASSTGVSSLLKTFRSLSADGEAADNAQVQKADLSVPFLRTEEEERDLILQLRNAARHQSNEDVATEDEFWLLAAIRARKGDITRALALMSNFIAWRQTLDVSMCNPITSEKMLRQLRRRMVFVSGNTDRDGRPILAVCPARHDPSQYSALDTVRMIFFVLEWTLRTYPKAQTHGVLFLNMMTGASLKNLDIRIPGVMQKAFARNIPVRIAGGVIINPPFVLKAVLNIMTMVMGDKLKARIRIFGNRDQDKLFELVDKEHVVDGLGMGGSASWTDEMHANWIERMMEDCKAWPSVKGIVDCAGDSSTFRD